eukprot:g3381.t1
MENATKAGSCAGISLSWGEELTRWVTYPAKQCCNSSPATLCQPHLRKVSFCAAESDFHPELNVHEWCEHSNGIPDEASCAAAGCIAHRGTHCECRSASSCQASSGAWRTQTCAENAQWMHDDPVMLEALMAAENGTDCADISEMLLQLPCIDLPQERPEDVPMQEPQLLSACGTRLVPLLGHGLGL